MDRTTLDSAAFGDNWRDLANIIQSMSPEEALITTVAFTESLATKQELGTLCYCDEIYAMRAAIRYTAKHVPSASV